MKQNLNSQEMVERAKTLINREGLRGVIQRSFEKALVPRYPEVTHVVYRNNYADITRATLEKMEGKKK